MDSRSLRGNAAAFWRFYEKEKINPPGSYRCYTWNYDSFKYIGNRCIQNDLQLRKRYFAPNPGGGVDHYVVQLEMGLQSTQAYVLQFLYERNGETFWDSREN